ncbi:hypothetical protein HYC85_007141 [Camellia sinensis]|uniref:Cdc6 C-terminal domain-containing protein n=1 Tax=Camellia sinensis TaxID=4442 RepID=A0A7J7HP14_CAMSI|nr:hypothetical protein HYC85_007141 [Camellia sinensis]
MNSRYQIHQDQRHQSQWRLHSSEAKIEIRFSCRRRNKGIIEKESGDNKVAKSRELLGPGNRLWKELKTLWSIGHRGSAIEMLQAELRESACNLDFSLAENGYSNQQTTPACDLIKQGIDIVRVDHMAIALSKTYRSPIMDTVQSLPQHQQIILSSAVKLFRGGKKDTTIGELSKSYVDICKLTLISPVGIMELSSMCRVLGDQIEHMKLISLYDAIPVKWQDKLRRVALKVDEADVAFALQCYTMRNTEVSAFRIANAIELSHF